jgi:hypothetical protein
MSDKNRNILGYFIWSSDTHDEKVQEPSNPECSVPQWERFRTDSWKEKF